MFVKLINCPIIGLSSFFTIEVQIPCTCIGNLRKRETNKLEKERKRKKRI